MAISSTHPLYDQLSSDWQKIRDFYHGEAVVKAAGVRYLPATPGQILDGYLTGNVAAVASYEAYKSRAVVPDFFELGVRTLIGILNARPPKIVLPKDMEFMLKKATLTGDTLAGVLRKLHLEQLTVGRAGIIADMLVDTSKGDNHYLEVYPGEKVLNWDDGSFNDGFGKLNLVVLDESGTKRQSDYSWKTIRKYRVLSLGEVSENEPMGTYRSGSAEEDEEPYFITPSFRGKTLDEIPFVFVNTTDIAPTPERPPLLGLVNICATIYRAEADYRNTLFLQGQDTLVITGGVRNSNIDDTVRVGASARIDVEIGGDAKYVGIGAGGLPEQRMALEADRSLAAVRTGQLLAPGKMSMESGEALKTRVAAQTATLTTVAVSSAAALEEILNMVAVWRGNPKGSVTVTPNLDFTNLAIAAQDVVQLVTAKNLGAPISYESIHMTMRERGMTRATYEEELELIAKDPKVLTDKAEASGNLNGNNSLEAGNGPTKKPAVKAPVSNKPKN